MGIRSPIEDVLAWIVVFLHELASHGRINSSNRQDQNNVEGHEGINAFEETRLLELVLALVHDEFAVGACVHHEATSGLAIAQTCTAMHKLFYVHVDDGVLTQWNPSIEWVQVSNWRQALNCESLEIRLKDFLHRVDRQLWLQVGLSIKRSCLDECLTRGVFCRQ